MKILPFPGEFLLHAKICSGLLRNELGFCSLSVGQVHCDWPSLTSVLSFLATS